MSDFRQLRQRSITIKEHVVNQYSAPSKAQNAKNMSQNILPGWETEVQCASTRVYNQMWMRTFESLLPELSCTVGHKYFVSIR